MVRLQDAGQEAMEDSEAARIVRLSNRLFAGWLQSNGGQRNGEDSKAMEDFCEAMEDGWEAM